MKRLSLIIPIMAKDTESVVDSYPANDEHPGILRKRLQVAHNPSSYAPSSKWSNRDMDPTPPGNRTWSAWDYLRIGFAMHSRLLSGNKAVQWSQLD